MTNAARTLRALLALVLLGLPAGGIGAAKLFTLGLDDVARGRAEVIDLTHDLTDSAPLYPGGLPFELTPLTTLADGYYMNSLSSGEHTGTHVDAPAHFGKGLPTVDEIPPVRLVSIGVQIDVRAMSSANPDYALTIPHLAAWEKENGRIQPHSLVLLNTGWHQRWEAADRYLNRDETGKMRFPGFSVEALSFLVKERNVNGVGIDTLSIDPGASAALEGHRVVLLGGRFEVENLDNLDLLPVKGFTVIVAPLKISRGSGSPARVLAIVPR